jgi:hypothetical protein
MSTPATPHQCRSCRSTNTTAYTTKPPRKHNGPCTPECLVEGRLCLNCRLFSPMPASV